jgi:hypothetical protein
MWLLTGIKETGEKLFSGLVGTSDKFSYFFVYNYFWRYRWHRRHIDQKSATAEIICGYSVNGTVNFEKQQLSSVHLLERKIQAVSNKNLALLMLSFCQRCNDNF